MIGELLASADVTLRLAVVEYRDHPPLDPLVYRVHPFTDDLTQAQQTINKLKPGGGGGDGPESVLDGVVAACRELAWGPDARRIAVLVGDAPPHGVGYCRDAFPQGCPCGETIDSATAAAEEARVTLYALGLTAYVQESFGRLSRFTGGRYFDAAQGDAAVTRIKEILAREFGNLEFDRRVFELRTQERSLALDGLATRLASSRPAVSAALSRLGARGLI
jgi:hypothetical protein